MAATANVASRNFFGSLDAVPDKIVMMDSFLATGFNA
jgi:hypothetical protein